MTQDDAIKPSRDERPDPMDYKNTIAYRIAAVMYRNGQLADALGPEELMYLRQAPLEIERLQAQVLFLIERLTVKPPPIVTPDRR